MDATQVIRESAERGIEVAGAAGAEQEAVNLVRIFSGQLKAAVRDEDVPGLLAPAYLFRGGKQLGPGLALALNDRLLLGWMKGLLRKPVTELVPLGSITQAERETKPAGGRLAKPNVALRLSANYDWELLFGDGQGSTKLRDELGRLLGAGLAPEESGA